MKEVWVVPISLSAEYFDILTHFRYSPRSNVNRNCLSFSEWIGLMIIGLEFPFICLMT